MACAIIKNADQPELAYFLTDEWLDNLIFKSAEEAESYLMKNAEQGVVYRIWDG